MSREQPNLSIMQIASQSKSCIVVLFAHWNRETDMSMRTSSTSGVSTSGTGRVAKHAPQQQSYAGKALAIAGVGQSDRLTVTILKTARLSLLKSRTVPSEKVIWRSKLELVGIDTGA